MYLYKASLYMYLDNMIHLIDYRIYEDKTEAEEWLASRVPNNSDYRGVLVTYSANEAILVT